MIWLLHSENMFNRTINKIRQIDDYDDEEWTRALLNEGQHMSGPDSSDDTSQAAVQWYVHQVQEQQE